MKKLLYLAAAASCLLLVSCGTENSITPVSSSTLQTSISTAPETQTEPAASGTAAAAAPESTQTSFPRFTSNQGNDFYEINCPFIPAAEADLTVTRLDFPSEIDGLTVGISGFIDEETLLVFLVSEKVADSGVYEMGTISLQGGKAGAYQKLLSLDRNTGVSVGNDRWIIISEADKLDDPNGNPARIYRLYDLKQKKLLQPFWTQSKDELGYPVGGGSWNSMLIIDDILYFDDYSMKEGEMAATMYGYDISSGNITENYPDCQKPMLYQGKLIGAAKNDTGQYHRLISVKDNGASFKMEFDNRMMLLEAGPDGIYASVNKDTDSNGLTISNVQNLTTGQVLITANTVLGDLNLSDSLIGWSRSTGNYAVAPALYDIRNQRLISFDKEFPNQNDSQFFEYIKGNTALIYYKNLNEEQTAAEALLVKIP